MIHDDKIDVLKKLISIKQFFFFQIKDLDFKPMFKMMVMIY